MKLWRVLCNYPAHGYKEGRCDGVLLKMSSTGGIEVKCHKCNQMTMIHRTEIEQYRYEPA